MIGYFRDFFNGLIGRQIYDLVSVNLTAYLNGGTGKKVLEEIQEPTQCAKASVNLINAYGEANDLVEARAIFNAMGDFGESEEVRVARAKASFNLIVFYGKAGQCPEARKIHAAMADLGNSPDVLAIRNQAAAIISRFCS
jgi:pentatricopeptide repeat protein